MAKTKKAPLCPVDGAELCESAKREALELIGDPIIVKGKDALLADILEDIVDMLYTGVDLTRANNALSKIRTLRE